MDIENGKFSIEKNGDQITINEWQGETKVFTVENLPIEEIADCIMWMDDEEMDEFKNMISPEDFEDGYDYAVENGMIEKN